MTVLTTWLVIAIIIAPVLWAAFYVAAKKE